MHLDIYEGILFKLDVMIDTTELYILILNYMTLIQGQGMWERNRFCGNISQSYEKIQMEFCLLLRLVRLINLILKILLSD